MGLAERRVAKEFQDRHFPQWQQKIDRALGRALPLEIDWNSLQLVDESALYHEAWPKVYFEPLVLALEAIAVDALGREALAQGVKRIVIRHSGTKEMSFTAGTLLIDLPPTTNIDDVRERERELTRALERGL
ncbi:MAG TPA: hypothetical protein VKT70_11925 [Stellaceae bacterium]|nr:hypothetical protein [Stellaceae bacterium]